jgi:hypothetical protein
MMMTLRLVQISAQLHRASRLGFLEFLAASVIFAEEIRKWFARRLTK